MIDTPIVTTVTAQRTACIPLIVTFAEMQLVMGPGIQEIFAALGAQGIAPTGAWFTHHRRRPTDTFDFSICVPIATPVKPVGRVQNGERRAARIARTIYAGPYEGLGAAWGEFHAWIAAQGHKPQTDLWEAYLRGPESGNDPSAWRTELSQPLA
jgi:effector-binding domain-containing protein